MGWIPPSRAQTSRMSVPYLGGCFTAQHRLPVHRERGFPGDSAGKESACNVGDLGLIPGLGRSPGEGKGYPLQYPGLENSMDCIVLEATKSLTRLIDFDFHLLMVIQIISKFWLLRMTATSSICFQESVF